MGHSVVDERGVYTKAKLQALRKVLPKAVATDRCSVVIGGSYARGEASTESDLDFYIVCDDATTKTKLQKNLGAIKKKLHEIVPKPPATGGAFAEIETIEEMVSNIGGGKDSNEKITRRVLFLLEGEWLYGSSRFTAYRERLVRRYIRDSISEYQLSRFLLNDLIRYYRTICVDFEYKTGEEKKSWGLRNLKLLFSRKLLYFSGLLVAAEAAHLTPAKKVERTLELLALTPINRVRAVCGTRANNALAMYGGFLEAISDSAIRKMADSVPATKSKHPEEFRRLKNEGHRFTWELARLIDETYVPAHPIHVALIL